jgi:SAM-dependent methyltransferase
LKGFLEMSVFASQYANQYDAMYADKDYEAECDLVAAAAKRHGVAMNRILDIGCGTGGHSLEWARRGIASVGVDLSPSMIEIARAKSARMDLPGKPEWMQGDARTFDAGGQFDVATMMFAVLGYMTGNDDIAAALTNVRRHLRPGGVFVFDVWYGPAVLSVRPEGRVRVIEGQDGTQTIRAASTQIDSFRHLAEVTFQLWAINGARYLGATEERHQMRYFFPQELQLFLSGAGFEQMEIRAFPGGGPPDDSTWNVYCAAVAA